MKPIQDCLKGVMEKSFKREPIALCLAHWGEIAGPELSTFTWPQKFIFPKDRMKEGELHIVVPSVQHAMLVRERYLNLKHRINCFFKRDIVARLAIKQLRGDKAALIFGTFSNTSPAVTQAPQNALVKDVHFLQCVQDIPDKDLQMAFMRLSQHITQHRKW